MSRGILSGGILSGGVVREDFVLEPDTLYILGVYVPSSSHNTEVYDEYFDYLWALYESQPSRGMVLIMGDFNGDLGNSLGDKGKREPNLRGL